MLRAAGWVEMATRERHQEKFLCFFYAFTVGSDRREAGVLWLEAI